MKKTLVVIVAMVMGGVAFASSLSVPWFVDTGPAANKLPPATTGVTGLVYLHNNKTEPITCSIRYFTQGGNDIGPEAPNNTFVIAPQASLAFRPVAYDPDTVGGGQEATDAGLLVPDRPMDTSIPGNNPAKKNGSLVVTWLGAATDVQGVYTQSQYVVQADSAVGKLTGYGHLLPPGA